MGGFSLGIAIEMLVAVLLAVTIGYCVLVNRKLVQLRSDQSELKSIVRDLHQATDHASHAIIGLRESAATADETLGVQLERVKVLDKQLRENIGRGDALLAKLVALPRHTDPVKEEAALAAGLNLAPATAKANPRHAPEHIRRDGTVGLGLLNAQRRAASGNAGQRGKAA